MEMAKEMGREMRREMGERWEERWGGNDGHVQYNSHLQSRGGVFGILCYHEAGETGLASPVLRGRVQYQSKVVCVVPWLFGGICRPFVQRLGQMGSGGRRKGGVYSVREVVTPVVSASSRLIWNDFFQTVSFKEWRREPQCRKRGLGFG